MPAPPRADIDTLVTTLLEAGVEFIVVGGAAAVLHGAPITTQDLDIVPRRTEDNVARLLATLVQMDAVIREPANRGLRPTAPLLSGGGQLLLLTRLGPMDVLGTLHDKRGYDELLPNSEPMGEGARSIRVLDLDTLIEVKTAAARPKDKLVLPILLALRERKGR